MNYDLLKWRFSWLSAVWSNPIIPYSTTGGSIYEMDIYIYPFNIYTYIILSSLYPSLISFSSFTSPRAPYRIFLLLLPWLACNFHLVVITTAIIPFHVLCRLLLDFFLLWNVFVRHEKYLKIFLSINPNWMTASHLFYDSFHFVI